jgi:hypothetical protein
MKNIAVVILADIETHGDEGRLTNALELAKEVRARGGDARIVFDGAGTRWIPKLAGADGMKGELFRSVRDAVDGACSYCAGAFGVREMIKKTGVPLLDDFEGHPSLAGYLERGYEIVTF